MVGFVFLVESGVGEVLRGEDSCGFLDVFFLRVVFVVDVMVVLCL